MAGVTYDEVIEKVIKDVGEQPTYRQLLLGGVSGWITGYTMVKLGKAVAAAIGGSIFLLQLANQNGYININWDKVSRKAEKVAEKLEDSGAKPSLLRKVERFVDRKIDKAENLIMKKERKARQWLAGVRNEEVFFKEIHVFMAAYVAAFAAGMTTGLIIG